MATLRRQTLDQWIGDALIDGDKDGACVAMSLIHHHGSKESEIHAVRFTSDKKWVPKDLALLFQKKADGYAQDLPGSTQMFSLVAFYGDSPEPQAKHPFKVQTETEFESLGTEAPSEKGVMTQSMRHLESLHRENNIMTRHLVDALVETNKEQRDIIRDQNVEMRQTYTVLRELMLGRLTEEHKFKMEEAKAIQQQQLWEKLLEFGPLLLNSIVGGKLIPASKTDSMLLDAVVRTVPREKLAELAQYIPSELAAPLLSRLEELARAAELAESNASKALVKVNPNADAGGGEDE
jgi:hypothetical protein